MGYRRLSIPGGVDVLIHVPDEVTQRVRRLISSKGNKSEQGPARPPAQTHSDQSELAKRIAGIEWYHSVDIGGGVVTPGCLDHRPLVPQYCLPETLKHKRVLDVASYDGFWAFEFERRGAEEIVALDIENLGQADLSPAARRTMPPEVLTRPTGDGFRLCHEALKSKVRRVEGNIYELSPERLGTFDFVFLSDLLLHLMNPMKALQNIRSVTKGYAMFADVMNPVLPGKLVSYESGSGHMSWWTLSLGAFEQMIWDAGFSKVELLNTFKLGARDEKPHLWHAVFKATP